MTQTSHESYKQQLMSHGVDEPVANLAAQGCTALDEGRTRIDQEQAAIESAHKTVIESIKNGKSH